MPTGKKLSESVGSTGKRACSHGLTQTLLVAFELDPHTTTETRVVLWEGHDLYYRDIAAVPLGCAMPCELLHCLDMHEHIRPMD